MPRNHRLNSVSALLLIVLLLLEAYKWQNNQHQKRFINNLMRDGHFT